MNDAKDLLGWCPDCDALVPYPHRGMARPIWFGLPVKMETVDGKAGELRRRYDKATRGIVRYHLDEPRAAEANALALDAVREADAKFTQDWMQGLACVAMEPIPRMDSIHEDDDPLPLIPALAVVALAVVVGVALVVAGIWAWR